MTDDSRNGHSEIVDVDDHDEPETPEMVAHGLARVYHGLVTEGIPPEHAVLITRSVGPLITFEIVKAEAGEAEGADWFMTDQRKYVQSEAQKEASD